MVGTINKTKGTLVHERGLGKYIPCTAPCANLPCYPCPPDSFYPFRVALVPPPPPGLLPQVTQWPLGYPKATPGLPPRLVSSCTGKFKPLTMAYKILSKSSPSLIPLTTQYLERGAKAIRAQKYIIFTYA